MKNLLLLLFVMAHTCAFGQKKPKHVILIGIDGLGAYAFPRAELSAFNMDSLAWAKTGNPALKLHIPTFEKLTESGAYSLQARSVLPSSSAVNWTSMTMGAGPELHGYTEWGSQTPELPSRLTDEFGLFPSIFGLMRQQKPKSEIGVIYEWDGIGFLLPKKALSTEINCQRDSATAQTASKYIIEKRPELLFLHFSDVDHVGREFGNGTAQYYQQVDKMDRYLAQIMGAVSKSGKADDTVVIISADHGGINKGHGGKTMQEMRIPWIAVGKAVKYKEK
ncbi:alkaline phosphatase [Dyadobacter psychrotolerans]|uniref:alkaline phosphatase n=1 Tax=Dyadobacter psychrotolerans TaxID=2541721 RepID=UPI001C711A33|nr:alkaline phosphatase [Dyadobacter psychrotolerans]